MTDPASAYQMVSMLQGVIERGTGRSIKGMGIPLAGKTGTSQVRNISKAERRSGVLKNAERPWKERDHALFVAFAPIDEPRYSIAVVVEHGGSGSGVAAPIARDILRETQRRDPARDGSLDRIAATAAAAAAKSSNGG